MPSKGRSRHTLAPGRPFWRIGLSLATGAALASAAHTGQLPVWLAAWITAASLLTLVLYALDKRAALRQRWRIPESRLQLLALAGGWPGALLAQGWLRHKTAKRPFQWVFWLCVAVNLMLIAGLLRQLP